MLETLPNNYINYPVENFFYVLYRNSQDFYVQIVFVFFHIFFLRKKCFYLLKFMLSIIFSFVDRVSFVYILVVSIEL